MLQRRALLLAAVALVSGFEPNYRADANLHIQRLRRDIFNGPYDRHVAPTSNRAASGSSYSASGTDVFMQVRFFKVMEVAAAEGSMRLKVWMRMRWVDTRLAWNPADYGGVSTIYFTGTNFQGAEENEIWIPDITPCARRAAQR